jgi:hypothetical protein
MKMKWIKVGILMTNEPSSEAHSDKVWIIDAAHSDKVLHIPSVIYVSIQPNRQDLYSCMPPLIITYRYTVPGFMAC